MNFSTQTRLNFRYKLISICLVLGFVFFFAFGWFIPKQSLDFFSPIGSSVEGNGMNFYLEHATYFTDSGVLEVGVLVDNGSLNAPSIDLVGTAKDLEKNKDFLVDTQKITDDYFVFFLTGVAENVAQIGLQMQEKTQESSRFVKTFQPFFFTKDNLKVEETFQPKTKNAYLPMYYQGIILVQENLLKEFQAKQEGFQNQIEILVKNGEDMSKNVEILTAAEKEEVMKKMEQNAQEILSLTQEIEQVEKQKEDVQHKINVVNDAIEKRGNQE